MSHTVSTPVRSERTSRSARTTPISSKWSKIQDKLHHYSSSFNNSSNNLKQNDGGIHSSPGLVHYNNTLKDQDVHSPIIHPPLLSANSAAFTRTTSLPRVDIAANRSISTPALQIIDSFSEFSTPKDSPPIVEPYFSRNSIPKDRKVLINTKCCFCTELLSSKLNSEKLIELRCGHTCHEECLWLLLSHDDKFISDPSSIFPNCEDCSKLAVPADDSITDAIISRVLLSSPQNTLRKSHSSESLITSSNYEMPVPPNRSLYSPLDPRANSVSPLPNNKFQSRSLSNKNSKDLSIHIPDKQFNRIQGYPQKSHNRSYKSQSRGSSISAASSIVSSVPKSPVPNESNFSTLNSSISMSNQCKLSLAIQRSEYVSDLVKKLKATFNPSITEAHIDEFGLLRLVDLLLVSKTGESFKELIVYLFQYSVVLVDKDYKNMLSYSLTPAPIIKTPNSTILKISFHDMRTLYLSQDSSLILQKWIAGFCDNDFVFDSTSLSSSVGNDFLDDTTESEQDTTEYDDQVTLPVLLSPLNIHLPSQVDTPIVSNQEKTYFEKAKNLILVIDHEKMISEQTVTTLNNISKVMIRQFESFKMIYSGDSLQNIYSYGNLEDVVPLVGKTQSPQITSINDVIESLIDIEQPKNSYCLLILSNSVKNESLQNLPVLNQLIIRVQPSAITKSELKPSDIFVLTDSWDKIMEKVVIKMGLTFGGDHCNQAHDNDDGDDTQGFDSSDFDSDFNSDIEGDSEEDQQNTCDVTGHDHLAEEITRLQANNDVKTSRWSKLFKDIDDALKETQEAEK